MRELNILVLGSTGVGKSTWLNGIINYLTYSSLEEALNEQLLSVVQTQFQLTDQNYTMQNIRFGPDDNNENPDSTQSGTLDVRAHNFQVGDTLIKLIDTPGIGDTAGVKQDKENFEKIINYLSSIKELHGICILLKPNESKLNVVFEFCVKELLTHLHRSALKNIVFCFTHTRETFYLPGDSRVTLSKLLNDTKIDIKLDKSTMYCFDNEIFRYLCALEHKVQFDDAIKDLYSKSWDVTVNETNRLINYFKTLQPHVINDTILLNDAKKNLLCMSKPIASISANIQRNITEIKWKKEMLESSDKKVDELIDQLYIDISELEQEPLDKPQTVCTNSSCVIYHHVSDTLPGNTEYKTVCHEDCRLIGVVVDLTNVAEIKNCQAMACGSSETCIECGHMWYEHMHIKYQQTLVPKRVISHEVQQKLGKQKSGQKIYEHFISDTNKLVKELEKEQEIIIKASVKFGRYLSKNAIIPYNDVMDKYLDVLIDEEERKAKSTKKNDLLEALKKMREEYKCEVEVLKKVMAAPNAPELSDAEFKKLLNDLYSLKHNGQQLRNAFNVSSRCEIDKNKYEKFHQVKKGFKGFKSWFMGSDTSARAESKNKSSPTTSSPAMGEKKLGNKGRRKNRKTK